MEKSYFKEDWAGGGKGAEAWAVVLLFALALGLRLYKIGTWSFWEDEFFSLREVVRDYGELLNLRAHRYPLFYLLEKILLPLMPGFGDGSYRFPAAFLGAATIPLLYIAGKTMVGRRAALMAALFLAVSPWHLFWSQCCRYYTLVGFLVLVSFWVFWEGIKRSRSSTAPLLALIPGGLSIFGHPSSAFCLISMGLYMLWIFFTTKAPKGRRLRQSALYFLGACATIFLFSFGILQASLTLYMNAKGPNPVLHFPYTLGFYLGPPVVFAAFVSYFFLRKEDKETADMLGLFIVVPVLSIFVIGFFTRVTAQYVFYTMPFFYLLAAWGCAKVVEALEKFRPGREWKLLGLIPFGVILMVLVTRLFLYYHTEYGWRPRWKEAAEFIKERWEDGDVIAVANRDPFAWYMETSSFLERRASDYIVNLEQWDIGAKMAGLLNRKGPGSVWVVLNIPFFKEKDPSGKSMREVFRNFKLEKFLPVYLGPRDLSLFVFKRSPGSL